MSAVRTAHALLPDAQSQDCESIGPYDSAIAPRQCGQGDLMKRRTGHMERANSWRQTSHPVGTTYRPTRRRVLIALATVVPAAPIYGFAQQSAKTMPRIAFLIAVPGIRAVTDLSRRHERARLYRGQEIAIQPRFANGDLERLPALAKELADLKPDVILAQSTPGVRAVIATKTTAPIVMVAVGDPVGSGFVASLGGRAAMSLACRS